MSIETRELSTVDGVGRGPTARSISYAPSPYISATNVQAALDTLGVNYALTQSYAQSASASAETATSAASSAQGYATAAAASAGSAATQASSASASAATATSQASAAASSAAAAASYTVGWTGTSSSSVAIGTGSKTFSANTGKLWTVGTPLLISSNANTNNFMFGIVTGYVSGSGVLTVEVTSVGGSGTYSDWNISLSGQKGADGLGAGDVIGPGTNSDGWIPTWNLANSKTLANGIDPATLLSNSNTTAEGRALVNSTVEADSAGKMTGVQTLLVTCSDLAAGGGWSNGVKVTGSYPTFWAHDNLTNSGFIFAPYNGGWFQVETGGTIGALAIALDNVNGKVGIGGVSSPTAYLHNQTSTRLAHLGSGSVQSDASGNLSVSSDERLKIIDGEFTRSIEALRQIAPIFYRWNERSGMDQINRYVGFSAQNVQAHIPEAVGTDAEGLLTLSDRGLLATIVNAIKNIDQRLTMAGY